MENYNMVPLFMIVGQIAHSLYGVKVMITGVRKIKLLLI